MSVKRKLDDLCDTEGEANKRQRTNRDIIKELLNGVGVNYEDASHALRLNMERTLIINRTKEWLAHPYCKLRYLHPSGTKVNPLKILPSELISKIWNLAVHYTLGSAEGSKTKRAKESMRTLAALLLVAKRARFFAITAVERLLLCHRRLSQNSLITQMKNVVHIDWLTKEIHPSDLAFIQSTFKRLGHVCLLQQSAQCAPDKTWILSHLQTPVKFVINMPKMRFKVSQAKDILRVLPNINSINLWEAFSTESIEENIQIIPKLVSLKRIDMRYLWDHRLGMDWWIECLTTILSLNQVTLVIDAFAVELVRRELKLTSVSSLSLENIGKSNTLERIPKMFPNLKALQMSINFSCMVHKAQFANMFSVLNLRELDVDFGFNNASVAKFMESLECKKDNLAKLYIRAGALRFNRTFINLLLKPYAKHIVHLESINIDGSSRKHLDIHKVMCNLVSLKHVSVIAESTTQASWFLTQHCTVLSTLETLTIDVSQKNQKCFEPEALFDSLKYLVSLKHLHLTARESMAPGETTIVQIAQLFGVDAYCYFKPMERVFTKEIDVI